MATVVLQYVGGAVGSLIGGPIGGIIGRAAGAIAGNMIDQAFFGGTRHIEGPRLGDVRVMTSSEGAPIPRLWGRMRLAGQLIWATRFEEVVNTDTESQSAKAAPQVETTEYEYFANFAVGVCEGPIARIGRVWADGKELDLSDITHRVYRGTEEQLPDSLIVAKKGANTVPAYRGVAYVVFERLPIGEFGNRLPQLTFEVFRNGGGAEDNVRAVNIIPGSTEFGYDTEPVVRLIGEDATETENVHADASRSDFKVSLDQLTGTCDNIEAASLVVAWFGDDLRCGNATLRPGVEVPDKTTEPASWRVAGLERDDARLVSQFDGGPAFGGTPSDDSVIRALRDLHARQLKAVFYPFILMDIPAANGLADPYGGGEQAAYPWRGRITCHPAPGQPGTPDKQAACAAQVAAFVGTAQPSDFSAVGESVVYSGPTEWSYRRMVLHYAKLCQIAGNVEAFLIGSELRGLTTLRGTGNSFPFVQALVALAADVKAMLPTAKVSYAADWSEYFGYQPADGSGDVFFHLDPLWSSANVDFIGIDNYMPLTDWRDGESHADKLAGATSIHNLAYLKSRIAAGEGFDWYYASAGDRLNQIRSPITDGAYGKPWVFRYKDIKSWWLNPHFDRPGGTELATPTGWTPQSKPIWMTEAGCPAIDRGSNQPNVFVDPKSSESLIPHFSRRHRDDLIQNQVIRAIDGYWRDAGAHNPDSGVYAGRMVNADRIFFWAWDARPFPQFPDRTDVWSDGGNYELGHWLNGRLGSLPLAQLLLRICAAYGIGNVDTGEVTGHAEGFVIDRVMTAREALEGLTTAFAIDAIERGGTIVFRMRETNPVAAIAADGLVERNADAPLYDVTRLQSADLPRSLKLNYILPGHGYRRATVEALRANVPDAVAAVLDLPCVLRQPAAQARADVMLQEKWSGSEVIELALPPTRANLENGDVVTVAIAGEQRPFRIEEIHDGTFRKLRARSYDRRVFDPPIGPPRQSVSAQRTVYGKPDAVFMDLPVAIAGTRPAVPWLAVSAKPWPAFVVLRKFTSATATKFNRRISNRATMGRTTAPLLAGPANVFDRGNELIVKLGYGALSSVADEDLLDGANLAAVGDKVLGWEMLQFGTAELIAQGTYRLTRLLRGLSGSEPEIVATRPAGARFVLLNDAVVQPKLANDSGGREIKWQLHPNRQVKPSNTRTITHDGKRLGLRPLSPAQPRAVRDGGDVEFGWIRRTRIDGDGWDGEDVPLGEDTERYVFEVMSGATVTRQATVTTPSYRYIAADIAADFGGPQPSYAIRIAQLSAVYGRGANLTRTIHV